VTSEQPLLRIVRGDPTPAELAALVAVVVSLSGATAPATPPRSAWAAAERLVRRPTFAGPGAWRASALPE
jgi:hypothetical protein